MDPAASTVDERLARLSDGPRAAMETLRATIKAAAPEASEAISYGMPAFKEQGKGIVCYDAFKDHYSLFPMGGSAFDAIPALLPFRTGKGTIRFEYDQPLPVALVKQLVEFRIAENAERAAAKKG